MRENMLGKSASQETGELLKGVVERLFGSDGEYWAEVYKKVHRSENPFADGTVINPYRREVKSWEKFYKKVFGEIHDFSGVRIPSCPGVSEKEWWLVIVAKGMKPQRLFEKCRDKFGAWKSIDGNLDEVVTSDRTADKGHYAIWVRANVEADPEFKNLSANKLKEMNHNGITLEERLVLGLTYWWKTKKHIDIDNWTLCSGSRYRGGVPGVGWSGDELSVNYYYLSFAFDDLRSREVVSSAVGG